MSKIKSKGQVFTPNSLVKFILDTIDYREGKILQRHCIDNSCGEGAFLCEMVVRYCNEFLKESNNLILLKKELETYIHGIEIDESTYHNCIENLNTTARIYGIENVNWNVELGDALEINKFNNRMDYVVGNPPYVRVHNLNDNYNNVKKFFFAEGGMTDLYLVFYEIGFKMLKSKGKLCYITPSSWISSLAGKTLREYIFREKNLIKLIDLQHYQPFKVSTYTIISLFEKGAIHETFNLFNFNEKDYSSTYIDTLKLSDIYINGNYYLADKNTLKHFNDIANHIVDNYAIVKNGFATLADDIFIRETFPFESYTIPVIKASTGKWYKAFFPYDLNGKPLEYEEIKKNQEIVSYLNQYKNLLSKSTDGEKKKDWFLFGRTQALKDVKLNKYSINTCIKDINSIKLNIVPKGSGVYSGLYIITNEPFEKVKSVILCQEFIHYISLLKKYKSGGYYTFNSKDLQQYLNYSLSR